MANRTFNQFQGTLEKGVVTLFAEIEFAAGGIPTLLRGKGIADVVRVGTGDFQINLQDTYQRVLGISATWKQPGGIPFAPSVVLAIDGSAGPASGQVEIYTYDFSSTIADPNGTDVLLLTITLSNSTAL